MEGYDEIRSSLVLHVWLTAVRDTTYDYLSQ
jgi:hypothetical protein